MSSSTKSIREFVDLDRYPIHRPGSDQLDGIVEHCRDAMRGRGACLLEGFLRPERLAVLQDEVERLAPRSHHNASNTTTPYQETVSPDDASDHPRRRPRDTSVHVLAYDLIPPENGIRLIYEWDPLLKFLADVLDVPRLYRYEDKLAALNIAVNEPGDQNGWHFDQCDFVSSILIREAEAGGRFHFAPNIRNAEDENYDAVARILDGDDSDIVHLPISAGSLVLFKGRHSMHRVTPIERGKPRLIALLGYDTSPGITMSESARRRRFGRAA